MLISNYKDADAIINIAKDNYDAKVSEYKELNQRCTKSIEELDKMKLEIWASFSRFVSAYKKIKNKPPMIVGQVEREDIDLSIEDLNDIQNNSNIAIDIIGGVVEGVGVGIASGTAIGAAGMLVGAIGTMGLTWVGIEGGFGVATSMAGVWLSLYGISASPLAVIAVPALIISGIFMNAKSKGKLDDAMNIYDQSKQACEKLNEAIEFLERVLHCSEEIQGEIKKLNDFYMHRLKNLENLLESKTDFNSFSSTEQYILASTIILFKLLKDTLVLKLIDKKEDDIKVEEDKKIECNSIEIIEKVKSTEKERIDLIKDENKIYINDTQNIKFSFSENENIGSATKKTEYCFDDSNRDIAVGKEVIFENKIIVVPKQLHVDGKVVFRNCEIILDYDGSHTIVTRDGTAIFENCNFIVKKVTRVSELGLYGGTMQLHNCTVCDQKYYNTMVILGSQDENQQSFIKCADGESSSGKLILENCIINNCVNTFIHVVENSKAIIKNCEVKGHTGNFLEAAYCNNWESSGVEIIHSNFSNARALKKKTTYKQNEEFNREDNVLILVNSSKLKCIDTCFSNIKNYLILFDGTLGGECYIKNCFVEDLSYIDDMNTYDKLFDIRTNGIIENCTFISAAGCSFGSVSEFGNNEVKLIHNQFIQYKGELIVEYGSMIGGLMKESDIKIKIVGKSNGNDSYISVISDVIFEKCNTSDSLIYAESYLDKNGICVSIQKCQFNQCNCGGKVIQKEIKTYGAFGKEKYLVVATEELNQYK